MTVPQMFDELPADVYPHGLDIQEFPNDRHNLEISRVDGWRILLALGAYKRDLVKTMDQTSDPDGVTYWEKTFGNVMTLQKSIEELLTHERS